MAANKRNKEETAANMVTTLMVPIPCTNCGEETTTAWENKKRTVLLCPACVANILHGQAERAARAKAEQVADIMSPVEPARPLDQPATLTRPKK